MLLFALWRRNPGSHAHILVQEISKKNALFGAKSRKQSATARGSVLEPHVELDREQSFSLHDDRSDSALGTAQELAPTLRLSKIYYYLLDNLCVFMLSQWKA